MLAVSALNLIAWAQVDDLPTQEKQGHLALAHGLHQLAAVELCREPREADFARVVQPMSRQGQEDEAGEESCRGVGLGSV